jgi:alkyldihydroxyacetonephosphate synthase
MTDIARALARDLGTDRVADDPAALDAHRKDYWVLAHLRARQGKLPGPACIVTPRSTAEVAKAVRIAQQHGVPIVPFGAGSGVVGGATPPAGTVLIDMRAMSEVLELNESALWVRVQAGMMGHTYDDAMRARGYTTGHYPQSIALSTVGGWVATRAAGQFSTKYGNIEDLLLALEVVLPSGHVARTKNVPRAAAGPSLQEVFLGSEGTLGIVTEVTLKLHPLPERRELSTYAFATMQAGLEAIQRVTRVGWRPAVVRLYDAPESGRHFASVGGPADRCLLLVVNEGPATLVDVERKACAEAAAAAGGTSAGAAPVEHWLSHRNEVPSWEFFFEREIVVDTIEIAADWDRVGTLYDAVVAALNGVPGMLSASAHSSHSYPQGTNLYISFAVRPPDFAEAERSYLAAWSAVMRATLDHGGTIAHHHGIGRLRAPWLAEELGTSYPVLQDLKRALDPKNLMNPGALLA